jgi:DNA-binding transcriptional ArsR family regulator
VTLGDAIRSAHARGDTDERNRLMALANSHATVRDLAELLGLSASTVHKHLRRGQTGANACSWHGMILLENQEIAPAPVVAGRGLGTEGEASMQGQGYTRTTGAAP